MNRVRINRCHNIQADLGEPQRTVKLQHFQIGVNSIRRNTESWTFMAEDYSWPKPIFHKGYGSAIVLRCRIVQLYEER